jgi:hypothetical protein
MTGEGLPEPETDPAAEIAEALSELGASQNVLKGGMEKVLDGIDEIAEDTDRRFTKDGERIDALSEIIDGKVDDLCGEVRSLSDNFSGLIRSLDNIGAEELDAFRTLTELVAVNAEERKADTADVLASLEGVDKRVISLDDTTQNTLAAVKDEADTGRNTLMAAHEEQRALDEARHDLEIQQAVQSRELSVREELEEIAKNAAAKVRQQRDAEAIRASEVAEEKAEELKKIRKAGIYNWHLEGSLGEDESDTPTETPDDITGPIAEAPVMANLSPPKKAPKGSFFPEEIEGEPLIEKAPESAKAEISSEQYVTPGLEPKETAIVLYDNNDHDEDGPSMLPTVKEKANQIDYEQLFAFVTVIGALGLELKKRATKQTKVVGATITHNSRLAKDNTRAFVVSKSPYSIDKIGHDLSEMRNKRIVLGAAVALVAALVILELSGNGPSTKKLAYPENNALLLHLPGSDPFKLVFPVNSHNTELGKGVHLPIALNKDKKPVQHKLIAKVQHPKTKSKKKVIHHKVVQQTTTVATPPPVVVYTQPEAPAPTTTTTITTTHQANKPPLVHKIHKAGNPSESGGAAGLVLAAKSPNKHPSSNGSGGASASNKA